jgi:hypothetical protein
MNCDGWEICAAQPAGFEWPALWQSMKLGPPDPPHHAFPAMSHPNAQRVRELVLRTVPDFGIHDTALCGETLLLRDGYYCGRSFKFEGLRAIWLTDANQVKFYSDAGRWLATIELEEAAPRRKAA